MSNDNLLKGLTKEQQEQIKGVERMGEWLVLFGKGMRLPKGLNKKDRIRLRKLTDEIIHNDYYAQRSRS